jgi:hypothetical protein
MTNPILVCHRVERLAGSKFDPRVVAVFLQLLQEGLLQALEVLPPPLDGTPRADPLYVPPDPPALPCLV